MTDSDTALLEQIGDFNLFPYFCLQEGNRNRVLIFLPRTVHEAFNPFELGLRFLSFYSGVHWKPRTLPNLLLSNS